MRSFTTCTLQPNKIRMTKSKRKSWAGRLASMGMKRNVYWFSVGKQKVMIPLERSRHKWENNAKMDLREAGLGEGGGWTGFIWLSIETSGRLL
jgi:hypothetical protein